MTTKEEILELLSDTSEDFEISPKWISEELPHLKLTSIQGAITFMIRDGFLEKAGYGRYKKAALRI